METVMICFPAPLNTCVPVSYGTSRVDEIWDEDFDEPLKEAAEAGCYLCQMDEIFAEAWD